MVEPLKRIPSSNLGGGTINIASMTELEDVAVSNIVAQRAWEFESPYWHHWKVNLIGSETTWKVVRAGKLAFGSIPTPSSALVTYANLVQLPDLDSGFLRVRIPSGAPIL
jgi:hypothetical protein